MQNWWRVLYNHLYSNRNSGYIVALVVALEGSSVH